MFKYIAFICLIIFPMLSLADTAVDHPGKLATTNVVIASSGTVSSSVDLNGYTLVGIIFPTMTGTTTTFKTSSSLTGTYVGVYNSSGAVSYTTASSRYYAIDPKDFEGVRYLQVVSGSAEGAARTLLLVTKSRQ